MDAMGANVVEVETANPRRTKQELTALAEVISTAQLGARLRVLVSDIIDDPVAWIRQQRLNEPLGAVERVRPSLEDVFVTSTGASPQ
jgi:ABC-2 type transport system ATP-binding protein